MKKKQYRSYYQEPNPTNKIWWMVLLVVTMTAICLFFGLYTIRLGALPEDPKPYCRAYNLVHDKPIKCDR